MLALTRLWVNVTLSGISVVLDVPEDTLLAWLKRAAEKAQHIHEHVLKELPVTQRPTR